MLDFDYPTLITEYIASRSKAVVFAGHVRSLKKMGKGLRYGTVNVEGEEVVWSIRRLGVECFYNLARYWSIFWLVISYLAVSLLAERTGTRSEAFEGRAIALPFFAFTAMLYFCHLAPRNRYMQYRTSGFEGQRRRLIGLHTFFLLGPCALLALINPGDALPIILIWIIFTFPFFADFIVILLAKSNDHDDAFICYDLKSDEELHEARERTRRWIRRLPK